MRGRRVEELFAICYLAQTPSFTVLANSSAARSSRGASAVVRPHVDDQVFLLEPALLSVSLLIGRAPHR